MGLLSRFGRRERRREPDTTAKVTEITDMQNDKKIIDPTGRKWDYMVCQNGDRRLQIDAWAP